MRRSFCIPTLAALALLAPGCGKKGPGAERALSIAQQGAVDEWLALNPADRGLTPPADGAPYALMMITVGEEGPLVMAADQDGFCGFYGSERAVIPGGEVSTISDAARAFVSAGVAARDRFSPAGGTPAGRERVVRFYAISQTGATMAEVAEAELERGGHPLGEIHAAGRETVKQFGKFQGRRGHWMPR